MTEIDVKALHDEVTKWMETYNEESKKIAAQLHGLPENYSKVKSDMEEHAKKMNEIKDAVAELQLRATYVPEGKGDLFSSPDVKAFGTFARTGQFDAKNMAISNSGSMGYAVPPAFVADIIAKEGEIDPIRQYCSQITVNSNIAKLLFEKGEAGGQWSGETDTRGLTTPPSIGMVEVEMFAANVYVAPTRDLLTDGVINIEQYISQKLVGKLAKLEGAAFLVGTGTKQPEGVFVNDEVEEKKAALSADNLIDLWGLVPTETDANAIYVVNKATAVAMRKLKDTAGQYLWQAPLSAGAPSVFNGFPVVIAGSAPKNSAVFGNFRKYQIVDNAVGMTVIRDEYSQKHKNQVEFFFSKRVGGAVVQPSSFAKLVPTA